MNWTWWPAVQRGAPWDGGFEPYPAAVAVALLPAVAYLLALLIVRRRGARGASRRQIALFALGTLALVAALAWPLARMATAMLAARTAQYLLVTLAAAPLLLLGIPRWSDYSRGRLRRWAERLIGSPKFAAPALAIVVVVTHTTGVVDAEVDATAGAAVRMAWLAAALLYWWPLVGPGPERERLPYLGALGFLVLPFVFPKLPGVVYVFAEEPLYEVYATSGKPGGLTAAADQGLAGFLLWFPGSVMVLAASWVLFRHWQREDRRLREPPSLAVPADPEAIDLLVQVPGAWNALEHILTVVEQALPDADGGADLAFEVVGRTVVLVVRLHASAAAETALRERIAGAYAAYLGRIAPADAPVVASRLRVEVVGYGSRVQ